MAFISAYSPPVIQTAPPPLVYVIPRHLRESTKVVKLSKEVHGRSVAPQKAMEAIENTLTDYSKQENLMGSLSHFAEKILHVSAKEIEIREADEVGWSGDKVFGIWKEGKCLKIFKIFQEGSKNFLPELFSLEFLKSAKLKNFSAPKIDALGKCVLKGEKYFLLCESVAPGKSLLQHYRNQLEFDDLKRAVFLCGQTLARLHQHVSGKPQGLPEELEKITREYLDKAIKNLKVFPQQGIDSDKLQAAFELTVEKLKSEPFATGVIHGDTKLINVFFDPETNTITWIDPPKLSDSIDHSGNPIGIPAKDFYSFIADIEYQQVVVALNENKQVSLKQIFSNEEMQKLKEAFSVGYKEAGGQLPTQSQLDFLSMAAHLYFIAFDSTSDPNCSIPEPLKSSKMRRMAKIFDDLRIRL